MLTLADTGTGFRIIDFEFFPKQAQVQVASEKTHLHPDLQTEP